MIDLYKPHYEISRTTSETTLLVFHAGLENAGNFLPLFLKRIFALVSKMRRIFSLCFSEFSRWARKCGEFSLFVLAKLRWKHRETTLEFSSEISSKVRRDKERNSRISLSLLFHNTVSSLLWSVGSSISTFSPDWNFLTLDLRS